ncbi:MAG: hypothetical protein HZB81_01470 [Deltaproteobacteria bacterium]|nr:hypothetical protein [Deltaproteobacteria bacterium]
MVNQKGVSITAVVFIIVILSFMGVIFVSLLTTGVEESVVEYDSSRALYIAEGGAEAIIGKLKQSPPERCGLTSPDTCWNWNDGYLNRALGDDHVDVEVLQYENRDCTGGCGNACESFVSSTEIGGDNPARTIYTVLTWAAAAALDINLYSNATCTTAVANVSKTTLSNAVFLRYRITAAPATPTYYVGVTNGSGVVYQLRISHPDEPGFTSSDSRSLISLGKMNNARREVFTAFCRQGAPACP